MKMFTSLLGVLAFCLYAAGPVHADPLTLNGVVNMPDGNTEVQALAHLITDQFDINVVINTGLWPGSLCFNTGCPGSTLNVTAVSSPNLVNGGSGTIQGVNYPQFSFDGNVTFTGPPIPLPAGHPGDMATLTGTFNATGLLEFGHTANDVLTGHFFYTANNLVGSGTAVFNLVASTAFPPTEPAHWLVTNATYTFGAAAPTPEPLTMLLFGSGLGLVGMRYRKNRL